jgi:hypothetical protein
MVKLAAHLPAGDTFREKVVGTPRRATSGLVLSHPGWRSAPFARALASSKAAFERMNNASSRPAGVRQAAPVMVSFPRDPKAPRPLPSFARSRA